ncbi:MAG: IS66 family transposase [Kofleriaceae bacterium]
MADVSVLMSDAATRRIAELEDKLAEVTVERDHLRLAYDRLKADVELMRRRLFDAKAERLDTAQLELEFAHKVAALDAMNRELGLPPSPPPPSGDGRTREHGNKSHKPSGRRDLREVDLPEERIEILDPSREGVETQIGWEESSRISWRRGGYVRVIIARAKYLDLGEGEASSSIATAPLPEQILPRSIATPAMLAHVVTDKFCWGIPFHRQADRAAGTGMSLDRSLMCRWAEHLGGTVGATIVTAMRDDAMRTAFCIATDATGILVQPIPGGDHLRRGCTHAHFLVQIADRDHVFFEFLARETSAAIGELFRGFTGYVQADAKSVYDLLYRPPDQRPLPEDDTPPDLAERVEVGCWSHLRRKFWEAAITTKDPVAREAVLRVKRIFDLERSWRRKPHAEIRSLRELHLQPHVDAFFAWARPELAKLDGRRGMLASALGYATRHQVAFTRFLEDGRLELTNNRSERELRRVATGRKAWLFVGSDDHGQAAGNLMTLIASARLHALDP